MLVDGDGHELLEGEPDDEDGRGQEHEVGDRDGVVGEPVLTYRTDDAEEDGDRHGDDRGDDDHAQRDEQVRHHLGGHVLAVDSGPEVAVQGPAQPDPVALHQGIVEMEQLLPGDDGRVGYVRIG